jgi:hypothetical protein
LERLSPDPAFGMNASFLEIVKAGTGKEFRDGEDWNAIARPIMEAFLHMKLLLSLVVECSRSMRAPEVFMGSAWDAVFLLYNLR